MDKGGWKALNDQEEQIIALLAELNTLKFQTKSSGDHKNRHSKDYRDEHLRNRSRSSTDKLIHPKRNNDWVVVAPTARQSKTKSKWDKTHH